MSGMSPELPLESTSQSVWLRIKLVHFVYIAVLLASAFAVSVAWGILAGGIVLAFWTPVFLSTYRPKAFRIACLALVGVGCLMCCIPSMFSRARAPAQRMKCQNNVRQIALALHAYHDDHGQFPPAYADDEEGRPLHSWRVLILPYLEEGALYDRYDMSEPWNGPNNSKLLSEMPKTYVCPTHEEKGRANPNCTSYAAVVGNRTMWPGTSSRSLDEIKGRESSTILLNEGNGADILWMEPMDWTLDEALASVSLAESTNVDPHHGRHVALVNSQAFFVPKGVSRSEWMKLMTIDGEVPVGTNGLPVLVVPETPEEDFRLRLAIFAILALWPLPWVWWNPTSSGAGKKRSADEAAT